jgi:hypothetical protein
VEIKKEMQLEKGDIVMVVGSESIPKSYLGRYGRVTQVWEGYKVQVELVGRVVDGVGSLSHTAYPSDVRKIGVAN